MAIDIKNLVQLIQKKEHAVTSSTSVQDMIDIMKAAQKAEGVLIRNYDSAGDLPDAATTNERIAYLSNTRTLRFNNGTWDNPLLGAAPAASTYSFQGSVSGYTAGGRGGYGSATTYNIIDKFSLAYDAANAGDVGDLTLARTMATGQTSSVSGYVASDNNVIDKFPFATDGNATDVGDLTVAKYNRPGGQSMSSHGYVSGGRSPTLSPTIRVDIEKFSFSADGNATDVGDLTQQRERLAGTNSTDYGYNAGGNVPSYTNTIDKFPFATDANATDAGDLVNSRRDRAGISSTTHGYSAGGAPITTNIEKFSFASDNSSANVGVITSNVYGATGQSSTTSGYRSGGTYGPTATNVIDKFPFATDANAVDVGDLTAGRYQAAGQQV